MSAEPTVERIQGPAAPDGPVDQAITLGLGVLILVALVAMAAEVPYQIRVWLLVAGLVFCPALLVTRIVVGTYALITFVTAAGAGVAALMVLGQAMLVAHAWGPVAAAYLTLLIGLGADLWLLRERWLPEGWRRATEADAPDSVQRTEDGGG